MYWGRIRNNNDEELEKKNLVFSSSVKEMDDSNRIYFYGDVTTESAIDLIQAFNHKTNKLHDFSNRYNTTAIPLEFHVCSDGGDMFGGFAVMDYILSSKIPIYTYVEGCVASAATFLTLAGKKRFIYEHGFMLIHQPRTEFNFERYDELKDESNNMDKFMKTIRDFYKDHTKLTAKQIEGILKHDLFFDAKEALKAGLVDEIIT